MRVGHKVDDDLMELVRIGPQGRDVVGQGHHHIDSVRTQVIGEQFHRLLHDLVQGHRLPFRGTLPCDGKEVLHDARAAL